MKRRQFLSETVAVAAALALAPVGLARQRRKTPLVLVTADKEARIVAVDLMRSEVIGRVRTLAGPRSIETLPGGRALVCHTGEGAISLIDAATLTVARVVRGFAQPRYTALHPAGRYAYVSDSGHNEVVTIDVASGAIVHRTPVPGPARHISHQPGGSQLWTALGNKAARLALLDTTQPDKPRFVATMRPPFLAHDIVFDPSGERAWVSSGDTNAVCVYDSARVRPIVRLHADSPPQHISFHRERAYITSGTDGSLQTHDRRSGRQLAHTSIPDGSFNISEGWRRVVTPSLQQGTLTLLDDNGRRLTTLTLARAAHDACILAT